ncbi:MAG: ferritin-like domain-containing protein [Acidobacteriota bacterium]|nr:ferritin-like domain-containing protein [Acidobacteriota bacterium]
MGGKQAEINRRQFACRGLTAGVGSLVATRGAVAVAQPSLEARLISDNDILNFILNLDYLQAELYTVAISGRRIADYSVAIGGVGTAGDTVGGAAVAFEPRLHEVVTQLAADERVHVKTLRDQLGSLAVAKPAIDLEAMGAGFRSEAEFLGLARMFEDLVMTSYLGVSSLIGDPRLRATTVGLALAEAQHANTFRSLVSERGLVVPRFDALDVPPPPSAVGRHFNVDSEGLCHVRSASQALAVLYRTETPFAAAGGFFPQGLNGVVRNV